MPPHRHRCRCAALCRPPRRCLPARKIDNGDGALIAERKPWVNVVICRYMCCRDELPRVEAQSLDSDQTHEPDEDTSVPGAHFGPALRRWFELIDLFTDRLGGTSE